MSETTLKISEEMQDASRHLARQILHAFEGQPIIVGIATLIAVTGSVCFNEADGDTDEALKRARQVATGVIEVIHQLHESETGNGDDREGN